MGVAYKIIITALFYQDRASIFAGIEGTPTKSMLLSSKITKKYLMSPSLQLLQKSLISDLIAKGQSCPTSSAIAHYSSVIVGYGKGSGSRSAL